MPCSKKSCPKSVPGLTNMPKKYQMGNSTSNIYTSAWDWSDTVFNIKFKWSVGFECLHPVIFSPFRIFTICLICKCYENISRKTTMTFAFKMLKQMFLHTCFIPCIFPIIAFVIVPSKSEFISGFTNILLTTTLTCEKINEIVIITVEFMVYLTLIYQIYINIYMYIYICMYIYQLQTYFDIKYAE